MFHLADAERSAEKTYEDFKIKANIDSVAVCICLMSSAAPLSAPLGTGSVHNMLHYLEKRLVVQEWGIRSQYAA